ncbi:DUF3343 domain-containing protein [Anaerococcus tetradius]|uniref:DUF3343 domain-containing protein n=1 Tax=Anaerococcus tetradius TaxID=33036 RepID=UPI0023F1B5F1|nr:DUF3343 domain-containing protein [Anaerococcus tetradius]
MIVITFDTTTDAMMMELFSKANDFPGQLIPIPNFLSASCGLAFKSTLEEDQAKTRLADKQINYAKIYKIEEEKRFQRQKNKGN